MSMEEAAFDPKDMSSDKSRFSLVSTSAAGSAANDGIRECYRLLVGLRHIAILSRLNKRCRGWCCRLPVGLIVCLQSVLLQTGDQVFVIVVRLYPCRCQILDDRLDAIQPLQHETDAVAGDGTRRNLKLSQQLFACMRHRLQVAQVQESASPLDRVDDAKDIGDRGSIVRTALQRDQLIVQFAKRFACLGKKL